MSEEVVRENAAKKLESKITVLEGTVKALLIAIKQAESDRGVDLMPSGEYYGVKFE